MTHRVRGAFGRLFALGIVSAVALVCAVGSLTAQESTGKIEGTVTDQSGAPIANAQVNIVGTAFGALTSDKGYYFMNNVPAGTYTVRGKFIGYTAAEVAGLRVLAGQTITQNIKLTPSAVAIGPVVVEAAANPIVPRDQVTSKTGMTSADLQNLPVEDLRNVLNLQPGVVESGKQKGVSIRGGRPGEQATYIDGVLVRNTQRGFTPLEIAGNSVEEVSVTTGAVAAEFGDAESGVLSYSTKAGGQKYQGAFTYQTDDVNMWQNVGYNRIEASLGGPIKGNLTFFLGTTVTGQKSDTASIQSNQDRPIFVEDGIDTVVTQPATWSSNGALTDSTTIAIPRFVQYSGTCGQYGAVDAPSSSTAQTIRNNYGVACQGIRQPLSPIGDNAATAKLQYTYGNGSRISLSGLGSATYTRNLPLSSLYNPSNYTGTSTTSLATILNWTQNLARSAERAMALDVHLSYQRDNNLSGPLTRQSELDTRAPFGGFIVSPLDYLTSFNTTHTVKIGDSVYSNVSYLDDRQIQCVQAGEAACHNDVPISTQNPSNVAYGSTQPFRMNPYGVEQSGLFSLFTSGVDNAIDMSRESRWQGRANFDWQADRYNRLKVGGDFLSYDTRRYNSPGGLNSPFGLNAYHEQPVRYGAYVQDRLDLGDVVIVGGVRYDYYDSKAMYPYTPGRISSLPVLPSDSICFPAGSTPPLGLPACGTVPNATVAFNPYNPTASFIPAPSHNYWSPRIQVSFPVSENTNFRLSYAHEVQVPDFDLMFRGINTDLVETNRNQVYGRDLDFAKTIMFEFGIRHAFNRDMVLDVAAYNKDKVSDISGRLYSLPDPFQSAGARNEYATGDFRPMTNADFGNVRGVDVRLDRRFSNLFSGQVSYTLQFAKNTGSDPFSYTSLLGRQINNLTNETSPPPQSIFPTDDNREHNIAGSASLQFPADWRKGTTLGAILRNAGAFVTFRFASGLPYTQIVAAENGLTVTGRCGLECQIGEPVNSSTMPWFKNVDLRLTKGVDVGRYHWTLFAEGHNLFNFTNVINLFSEVADVVYPKYEAKFISEQVHLLATEATNARVLRPDSSVDFVALGSCDKWQGQNSPGSFASGPVDCVLLERAEARYGNGDGVFTPAEYNAAFNAWYNLANAPSTFYGTGRRIRIGAEMTF